MGVASAGPPPLGKNARPRPRPLALPGPFAQRRSSLHPPRDARVQRVAQAVAQHVHRQHHHRQAQAGRQRVAVCRGTACHVGGSKFILEELERTLGIPEGRTTEDMEYSLETVACIGCCGLAPCLTVNDEVSAKLTPKKVRKKFKKAGKGPK